MIIRKIMSRRMRLAGHVAHMKEEQARFWWKKSERRRPL
jgi:hypothetical protein